MNYGGARVNQHPPVHHLLDAHYMQEKGSISTPFLCVKKQDFYLSIYSIFLVFKDEKKMKYFPSVTDVLCIWQWHMT